MINEKGQAYRFAYDAAGRLATATDYYAHSRTYQYDAAGQMVLSTDALERTIAYTHDDAGRLVQKRFADEQQETFNWDRTGRLIGFESPDICFQRRFDADGNLIGEKRPGFTVEYRYDPAGQRIERTSAIGNTIGYRYDADGLVSALTINDTAIGIERNARGQISAEKLGEQLTRTYRYDEQHRLIHQHIAAPAGRIERHFEYDPAGNLIARTDSHKGSAHFTYDPMGRLIAAIDPQGRTRQYLYDPAGDLLDHLPETHPDLRDAAHEGRTYRFDAAGNLVQRQQDQALTRFYWDENNRLRTVRTPDGATVRMAYDALGRRTVKSVDGERTFFYWDGETLLAEKYEDGPAREYVYHPGTFEPLAAIDGDGAILYYHNDVNGLPCELTKPNGEIVWSAVYDALGRIESLPVSEAAQPLRLAGQYWDEEIALCYNRHRYFDPHICSFISQDPIGLAGGENVYAYAPNVWGWVDPLGLVCKEASKSVSHGPMIPGPLDDATTATFRSGSYTTTTTSEATILYRVYGGNAKMVGPYWTRTKPSGPLQSQLDSALAPQWGNTAQNTVTIRVPKGTTIYEGAAAPQSTGVGQILGGGNQVYIPRVDPKWIQ